MSLHRASAKRYNKWITSGSVGNRPDGCHCCSIQILNRGNYTVFQIESYPCNTKTELCLREGDIQIQYKNSIGDLCINVCIAGAHARAGGKVEYSKQRYIDNADTIRKQRKQYYKNNADTMREQSKQYYKANTTKVSARIGVKHHCAVCAGRYTHGNRLHHIRTHKHQRAMQCATQASAHHDS